MPDAPISAAGSSDRFLVFSASLRSGSLNTKLAALAARTITANGGQVDLATMAEFDAIVQPGRTTH
jgi:chromate reductase